MTDKPKTEFIFLTESVAKSWARDASTFALFCGLIGIGIALNSSAMQWTGAIVGFITIISRASGKTKRMTREQAIKYVEGLTA